MKICEVCQARYEGALDRCPLDRGRLVEAGDPLLGRLVGAYRILAPLGRGGLATVYRARHEAVGRDVAVKILSAAVSRSPTLRQRFLREARAANRVRHPHVIDVADIGETEDGLAFLVMELLEGHTLAQEIASGPLAPERALAIAAQAASALAAVHALGVVHRDVKPANVIVLRRDGDAPFIKLLDFGLANLRGEHRLTASGELFGTPAYMAPEQIDGAPASPAVDLYALGCMLFEMLTGSLPYQGSAQAMLDQHLHAPPPRPSQRRAGLAPGIDDLVAALLAKDPAHRAGARAITALLASDREIPSSAARPPCWERIDALAQRLAAAVARHDGMIGATPGPRAEIARALAVEIAAIREAGPALLDALREAEIDLAEPRSK